MEKSTIIKKSLVFITISVVLILITVLLPGMLFADTTLTFTGIGDQYYNDTYHSYPTQILFHFDVTGISSSQIKSATLKVWAVNVSYNIGEVDEVYFNGHDLGHLGDMSAGNITEFTLDPSWVTQGQNDTMVAADILDGDLWVMVYDSQLIVNTQNIKKEEQVESVWVRNMPMKCYQVWVNADNKFEMVFWYPYRDNNWVKIYDINGKEVYSVNMPLDDPNIIIDLPNGMYTVKTFNDQTEPLQTFVIGK